MWTKVSREMTSAGYSRTYEQCREKMKKLRTEYKKISDKRKETGQGRYPEWDYFDAMGDVLAHKPSTQPEVVVDALADSQVQNTQIEDNDDDLTEAGSTSNTSDTTGNAPPSSTGTATPSNDATDTSSEASTSSQGQKKGENGTEKVSSRKRKRTKGDLTGELLDKMINMQEKSDKMLMELELKRTRLEEKQMEMDMQMQRK